MYQCKSVRMRNCSVSARHSCLTVYMQGSSHETVFDIPKGHLFSTASRPTLGPIQSHIQWVLGALSPRVNRQGREADHSPPTSAEFKNGGAIPPLPYMSSWHSA
jgi:hypothetical protein